MRSCLVLLVALALALALGCSGCGIGDSDDGLPAQVDHPVADAIDRLQDAFLAKDLPRLCAGVTAAAAEQAGQAGHGEPTTCVRNVRRLFRMIEKGGGWRHAGEPRVIDVETDGENATAVVALDEDTRARVPMTRSNGAWRLRGLFGVTFEESEPVTDAALREADFPPAGDSPVAVADGGGDPCPPLAKAVFPEPSGGCAIELKTPIVPLTILTAFGDFKFDDCSIGYRVQIDSSGRTWTDRLHVDYGPDGVACGDVLPCDDPVTGERAPWRGRIYAGGDGSFVHRTDMCMETCVGFFVGELTVRLTRDGDRWRAEPVDGGGNSGLRFESPLAVAGAVQLDATAGPG